GEVAGPDVLVTLVFEGPEVDGLLAGAYLGVGLRQVGAGEGRERLVDRLPDEQAEVGPGVAGCHVVGVDEGEAVDLARVGEVVDEEAGVELAKEGGDRAYHRLNAEQGGRVHDRPWYDSVGWRCCLLNRLHM